MRQPLFVLKSSFFWTPKTDFVRSGNGKPLRTVFCDAAKYLKWGVFSDPFWYWGPPNCMFKISEPCCQIPEMGHFLGHFWSTFWSLFWSLLQGPHKDMGVIFLGHPLGSVFLGPLNDQLLVWSYLGGSHLDLCQTSYSLSILCSWVFGSVSNV